MQALLMNLTQVASAPVPPQVTGTANVEAHPGKETIAFGNLLQALTSGSGESEEVPTGGVTQSDEEQSAALDGAAELAVLSWLQGMVGTHPLLNPETEPVSLTAEESPSMMTEPGVAGTLPMQESVSALEPSLGHHQLGIDASAQPEAASVESVPLTAARVTTEQASAEASQSRAELPQPSTQLGEDAEAPTADHLPKALTVPAWNRGRAGVFHQAHMHARGAAVTAGSPTAMMQEGGISPLDAARSILRPWSMEPRIWQQTASSVQEADQPINRASVAVSQLAAVRTAQLVAQAAAAGAAEVTVASGTSAEASIGFLQSDAVVSAERAPMQSAPLMGSVGAAVAQPEKFEQLPESGSSSREGVVAAAAQEVESFSELASPLTLRDGESLQSAHTQNQADAEAPQAESRLEPSTGITPSETSVTMELKAAVSRTARPPQATRLASKAESGQDDTMPESSSKVGEPAEATSVPSFSSPALRSSASSSETVNLVADQLSEPSEQLQAAMDAGIRQIKVSAEQKGEVTVKMQLYPEDLGEVRVNVRISEGAISAKFQAASREAAQVIKESLANLRQALDGQGFSQVSLTAESFGSNLAQHSDRRSRRSPFRDERNQRQVGVIVAESAEASASRPLSGLSRLDYRF